ncbi:unnamed protein product [Euphydryas editha]|uniref:Uncharacterized protein n=1 Tax=Euphydryas editha TaxID=104508 RepID=A0AAU9V5I5_EUPED|nr:unnamed protein product [Euphydryas editha]
MALLIDFICISAIGCPPLNIDLFHRPPERPVHASTWAAHDHKLTLNAHVASACNKAFAFYDQLARAARVSWGLPHPEEIRHTYNVYGG